MMDAQLLEGGFKDASRDASFAFRNLMTAMARPGTIKTAQGAQPPAPLSVAAGATLLTLCDPDTPLYLAGATDTPVVRQWLAFHTGAPLTGPETCTFALGRWEDLTPLARFPVGTPQYPDRSSTLIVECDDLEPTGSVLSGPGIRDTAQLSLPDPEVFTANNAKFPLGLDFIFTSGDRLAALPRSTRIG